ncbi:hypothetical protein JCM10207_004136 [Rhodosporidiobolus poonsookiae]
MLLFLVLAWLILQALAPRLHALLNRPSSPFTLRISPLSVHLDTTALNSLPAAVLARVPRLHRHKDAHAQQGRRFGAFWDAGAVLCLGGMAVAQVVLVVAAWRAAAVLWMTTGRQALPNAPAAGLVKRAEDASSPSAPQDGLLLRPLIPSLSSLPLVVLALTTSQSFHELGHALAAASEDIPLFSTGLHLYLLVLPTFYVALPSSSSGGADAALTDLRIAAAGVWHNLLLAATTWAISDGGVGLSRSALLGIGLLQETEEGVWVTDVALKSPLAPHLPRGTLITHLDDYELDASSSATAASTVELWTNFLLSRSEAAHDPYTSLGWCLPSDSFFPESEPAQAACCASLGQATAPRTADAAESHPPELCFSVPGPALQACLDPLPLLSPSSASSPPARCLDASSCAAHAGTVCARISERERVVRIGVRRAADGGEEEERATVLWKGERAAVARQVTVTSLTPRYWFVPLGLELTLERFYLAVTALSLSHAFFNLLPLPHLDGSHLLASFLSALSPSLPINRARPSSAPAADAGLLGRAIVRLRKVGVLRRAAEERELTERWARRWTAAVGAVVVGLTLVVEVRGWLGAGQR